MLIIYPTPPNREFCKSEVHLTISAIYADIFNRNKRGTTSVSSARMAQNFHRKGFLIFEKFCIFRKKLSNAA